MLFDCFYLKIFPSLHPSTSSSSSSTQSLLHIIIITINHHHELASQCCNIFESQLIFSFEIGDGVVAQHWCTTSLRVFCPSVVPPTGLPFPPSGSASRGSSWILDDL
jgi:hypothetical protein